MHQLRATVAREFDLVNELIIEQLQSDVDMVENVGHYIVDAGGKRLRPLLVLLCGAALGRCAQPHITFAAIIEFIHTATLLHDDVVDESDLRRGRRTANALWGNAASVLVGDFLYSRSFQMMVELERPAVMRILADTTNRIAEGEVLQLLNINNPDTGVDAYLDVIERKTAVLFAAATRLGAELGGLAPSAEDALERYGLALGFAFQIADDMLDYVADAGTLGKNIGADLAEGKPTLPLIHAIAHSPPAQAAELRQAIVHGGREHLDAVLEAVRATDALARTSATAHPYAAAARAALAVLPASAARDALADLADYAVDRSA